MNIVDDTKKHMDESLSYLKKEFRNLRTGRAHPGLIEEVSVEVYGSDMPLKSVATVTVAESRQLVVSPFDPQTTGSIAKSIEKANLNLQAIAEGNMIRIPVPPLNEDMRKDLVKQAKKKSEDSKVSIREARRKANDDLKKLKNDGEITEDDLKKHEKKVQELTDQFCKDIDALCKEKEQEIMSV